MFASKKTAILFLLAAFVSLAALAALLFWTTEQWQDSSDQAALAQTEAVGKNFYVLERDKNSERLRSLIQTKFLQKAKTDADLKKSLARYLKSGEISGAEITTQSGVLLDSLGSPGVVNKDMLVRTKEGLRSVRLEQVSPTVFVNELRSLTGQEFSLYRNEQILASTLPGENLPRTQSTLIKDGTPLNLANLRLDDLELVSGVYQKEVFVADSKILIPALLLFFLVFLATIQLLVQKSGQKQLHSLLAAMRRISEGKTAEKLPQSSFKEINLLHQAVEKMGQEVAGLVSSLRQAKEKLERTIQKSGDVFALGPSEEETLRVLLDLAINSTEAEAGIAENAKSGEKYINLKDKEIAPFLLLLKEGERGRIVEKGEGGDFFLALPLFSFEQVIGGLALSKGSPFSDEEKETLRYLASQAQVALENSELHARLKKEAATDDLTGLANRRVMRQALEKEFARSTRFDRPLSILLLDIDNFKEINDTYGHAEGDVVLKEIAQTIQKTVRHIDLAARWGGEEFLVLLPETDGPEAFITAERIQQMIRNAGPNLDTKITASIGIATYPQDGTTSSDMILLADQAMYKAKKAGKDCIATLE